MLMIKSSLVILIIIVIFFIIGNLLFLIYSEKQKPVTEKEIKKDKSKEENKLSPKFYSWIAQYNQTYNISRPYIKCIFDKTCNGTFHLELQIREEENISEKENVLKTYGSIQNYYGSYIRFLMGNPWDFNELLNLSFIEKIRLERITSDYVLVSEDKLHYCDKDNDCVKVRSGCCGCANVAINKRYNEDWSELQNFWCKGIGCIAVKDTSEICYADPKCVNNVCKLINEPKWICNKTGFVDICKSLSQEKWNKSDLLAAGKIYSCLEIFEICDVPYKEEIIENVTNLILAINITEPYEKVIKTSFTQLKLVTNENASCNFSSDVYLFNIKNNSLFGKMNSIDGKVHTYLLESLIDGGHYFINATCINNLGELNEDAIDFWVGIIMPVDYIKIRTGGFKTKKELQNLLEDYEFYDGESTLIKSTEIFGLGGNVEKIIIDSSEQTVYKAGTNPNNYLFYYKVIFSKNIDFSSMHLSIAEPLKIFKESYKVREGSTNNKIILKRQDSDRELILENNQPVKVNDDIITGTYISISNTSYGVSQIEVRMAMQDPSKDYIAVGEYYDDPIFNNIKLTFKSYSSENGTEFYIGRVRA
ncbi:hypothetical protein J4221_06465 [Candidatus Pacearchaeota archaeon]|nr:hypothetical protein [Candidatus Pacearchaeota archaeon]